MSKDAVTLLCLLEGEPFDRVFDVTISTSELISRLRRLIKEERGAALKNVDAADLTLWKVSIPLGDESALRKLDLEGSQQGIRKQLDLKGSQQGIRKLLLVDTIGEVLSNPPSHHIHVIVQIHKRRTASPSSPPSPKKQRRNCSPADFTPYQELIRRILNDSPKTSAGYSNPANILTLPFPFIGPRRPTERFPPNRAGTFEYMGRERFKEISEAVKSLKNGYSDIYVYGTIGYGKSYMLAALACYLFQKQNRVVYLPDCQDLAADFVKYTKPALLLAYVDDPDNQQEIENCKTVDDLVSFCGKTVSNNDRLYFIVDQYNALDHEEANKDDILNQKKDLARNALQEMTYYHYRITSASANYQSALFMEQKQTNRKKLSFYAGMTSNEMKYWWDNYKSVLPESTAEEKDQIEDLSGGIPLILRSLRDPDHKGKTFKDVESKFLSSFEVQRTVDQIITFAQHWKSSLGSNDYDWNRYMKAMTACILQKGATMDVELFDHRYFYVEKRVGHCTCGLARNAMSGFLRSCGPDGFLDQVWYDSFSKFKRNRYVLGFLIEQMCLSSIKQIGLSIGDLECKPPMSLVTFEHEIPFYQFPKTGGQSWTLYVPLAFNFKTIDGLVLHLQDNWDSGRGHSKGTAAQKKAHLIPIQITIANEHSKSDEKFFGEWPKWIEALEYEGYEVTPTFIWITEQSKPTEKVQEKCRITRGVKKLINPAYTRVHASVSDINPRIGRRLSSSL